MTKERQNLKKKVRVTFANEPGVDMGGLTKEWFLLVVRNVFHPEFGKTIVAVIIMFLASYIHCDSFLYMLVHRIVYL